MTGREPDTTSEPLDTEPSDLEGDAARPSDDLSSSLESEGMPDTDAASDPDAARDTDLADQDAQDHQLDQSPPDE